MKNLQLGLHKTSDLFFSQIASAKSQSVKGASDQPAFMGSCLLVKRDYLPCVPRRDSPCVPGAFERSEDA